MLYATCLKRPGCEPGDGSVHPPRSTVAGGGMGGMRDRVKLSQPKAEHKVPLFLCRQETSLVWLPAAAAAEENWCFFSKGETLPQRGSACAVGSARYALEGKSAAESRDGFRGSVGREKRPWLAGPQGLWAQALPLRPVAGGTRGCSASHRLT